MGASVHPKISRILSGDLDAAAWLYDTFAPQLLRRLGLRFGSTSNLDREDLLQDTFIYLLANSSAALRRFLDTTSEHNSAEEDLRRFIWNAACGVASNRRRSALRHPTQQLTEPQGAGTSLDEESPAIARDVLARLGDCLHRRGGRLYLYFQFRYFDGLKPSEIAAATGWSKKLTYKLKQALDEAVERCVQELGLKSS